MANLETIVISTWDEQAIRDIETRIYLLFKAHDRVDLRPQFQLIGLGIWAIEYETFYCLGDGLDFGSAIDKIVDSINFEGYHQVMKNSTGFFEVVKQIEGVDR